MSLRGPVITLTARPEGPSFPDLALPAKISAQFFFFFEQESALILVLGYEQIPTIDELGAQML